MCGRYAVLCRRRISCRATFVTATRPWRPFSLRWPLCTAKSMLCSRKPGITTLAPKPS
jgi:hypothetical protein